MGISREVRVRGMSGRAPSKKSIRILLIPDARLAPARCQRCATSARGATIHQTYNDIRLSQSIYGGLAAYVGLMGRNTTGVLSVVG